MANSQNARAKSDALWHEDMMRNDWEMPEASRWRRLAGVRWFRFVWHSVAYAKHEARWRSVGMIPSGFDEWVLYGIARGWEREPVAAMLDRIERQHARRRKWLPWPLYRLRYIIAGVRECEPWARGSERTLRQAWSCVADDCDNGWARDQWQEGNRPEDDARESLSYWTED